MSGWLNLCQTANTGSALEAYSMEAEGADSLAFLRDHENPGEKGQNLEKQSQNPGKHWPPSTMAHRNRYADGCSN